MKEVSGANVISPYHESTVIETGNYYNYGQKRTNCEM